MHAILPPAWFSPPPTGFLGNSLKTMVLCNLKVTFCSKIQCFYDWKQLAF